MASNTTQTRSIRKHKARTRGASRKHAIRRAQRLQSEKRLEEALGERLPLQTVRS